MLGLLKSVFLRPKVVDDFLDKDNGHLTKVGAWINEQQFTDEERAKMITGTAIAVREFSVATAKESTIRSKTRRSLAIMWIRTHLALVIATFIAGGLEHPQAQFFWSIVTSDVLFYGTAGVMIYFFGTYGIGAHLGKKK